MKYSCSDCLGHIEMDDLYDGQTVVCPHCSANVQLQPVLESDGDLVTAPPMIPGSTLADIAGPGQPLDAVASVLPQLRGYCTEGEEVMRVVVQSKLMAATLKPDLIAATNRRLIILRRGFFSCKMWDGLWIDVSDVKVEESITGATVTVRLVNGTWSSLDRLPKEAARSLYRHCQSMEEQMRVARYAQNLQAVSMGAAKVNVNIGR